MIFGHVNDRREAIVRIAVSNGTDPPIALDAIIDTGFNQFLSLPIETISRLNLRFHAAGPATLVDGTESLESVYHGVIAWDGSEIAILVDSIGTAPLIGMALLEGFDLTIRAVAKGLVRIEKIH